jgi:SAM-dependent methyltransferase
MTHGVRQIVRFNWPFYAGAMTAVSLAIPVAGRLPVSAGARTLLYSATGLATFWVLASLAASWTVYDRSPLMRWAWIPSLLKACPRVWINIHAGLDESTPALHQLFRGAHGRVLDIFDAQVMREPSIARARRFAKNAVAAEPADFRHLPAASASVDLALLLLAAHELRTHETRCALFAELRRILSGDGRVIVAEHLRDLPNFAAFGPGFLHFHSRRTWTRCFRHSGLTIETEFPMTPFLRVFVLRKAHS